MTISFIHLGITPKPRYVLIGVLLVIIIGLFNSLYFKEHFKHVSIIEDLKRNNEYRGSHQFLLRACEC